MKKIKLKKILKSIEYISFLGDESKSILEVEQLNNSQNIQETTLSWSNNENLEFVYSLKKGTYIVSENLDKGKTRKGS